MSYPLKSARSLSFALFSVLMVACSAAPEPTTEAAEVDENSATVDAETEALTIGNTIAIPLQCHTNADCKLADDYCGGCYCRALPAAGKLPACKGNKVACFVQPCRNKRAVCSYGRCVVASQSTQ